MSLESVTFTEIGMLDPNLLLTGCYTVILRNILLPAA